MNPESSSRAISQAKSSKRTGRHAKDGIYYAMDLKIIESSLARSSLSAVVRAAVPLLGKEHAPAALIGVLWGHSCATSIIWLSLRRGSLAPQRWALFSVQRCSVGANRRAVRRLVSRTRPPCLPLAVCSGSKPGPQLGYATNSFVGWIGGCCWSRNRCSCTAV